ncbi:MAG: hypothetical protein HY298_18095 [Verrucomicrobia bacterium]|nr:hypothetical protein [Verrucomicrobiota bacterium]
MNQDAEQLGLLSIFHYVVGGMMALFACIPILHITIGILMIVSPAFWGSHGNAPPPFLGWFFVILGGVFVLIGWSVAALVICSGRNLSRRKHYLYCLVVAGVSCMFIPFGTVLGVFTIIVLLRPTVKELFQETGPTV